VVVDSVVDVEPEVDVVCVDVVAELVDVEPEVDDPVVGALVDCADVGLVVKAVIAVGPEVDVVETPDIQLVLASSLSVVKPIVLWETVDRLSVAAGM